jgi:hydrogenase maturation protease
MQKDKIYSENQGNKQKRIKIVGFGNPYMADDGIGIKVVDVLLADHVFKDYENIEVIDGGTCGMDLIFILEQAEKIIVVDAVDAGQKTAEIVSFSLEEIREGKKDARFFRSYSLHDMGLTEVFEIIEKMGLKKEIKVIGIKPKIIGHSENLSEEIERKIPDIILKIKEEVF